MRYRHIPEIDALRGLAACGVAFFSHANMLTGTMDGPLSDWPGFGWLYAHGTSLVDLFFVLSGFVMCHVYLDRETGRISEAVRWRDFLVARLARLYPLHLLTLVLAALMLAVPAVRAMRPNLPYDAYHFILNAFFLQRSGLETYHSFNISAWSLTAEMAAYLTFFLCLRQLGGRVASASIAIMLLALTGFMGGWLNLYVARGLIGFFAGTLLWWHWPTLARVPAMFVMATLITGFWLAFDLIAKEGVNYLIASLLVWPSLIALACRGFVSRALTARPLQWLGDISFSVYLLHLPIYFLRPLLFGPSPVGSEYLVVTTLTFVGLVLGLSHISYRWFELPMRRMIRQVAEAPQRLVPA